jgi:glycosyltransferase involved in cell wall biosynthesis
MEYKNKLSIIIPTKDRPAELKRLLQSLRESSYRPDQLIIVDGGKGSASEVIKEFSDLAINYTVCDPPGLAKQRNLGLKYVRPGITLVGYLDDDIEVEKEAVRNILEYWEKADQDLGGTSFYIVNNITRKYNLLTRIFMISSPRKGSILKSGFNVIAFPLDRDIEAEWLSGGATIWKREIVEKIDYDEYFGGYGHFDDLDFSFRVKEKYKMVIVQGARIRHFMAPIKKEKMFDFGRLDVINRNYFVGKHKGLSKPLFWWATFGQLLATTLKVLVKRDQADLMRLKGMLAGIYLIGTNKTRGNYEQDIK